MPDERERSIAERLELVPDMRADTGIMRAALTSLLGERIVAVTSLGGGSTSETFAVTTPDRELVVKTNADAAVLARAVHNFEVLAGLGIPVPAVVTYDDSLRHAPFAIFVMSKLRGRELGLQLPSMSREQMATVAARVVAMQRAVAALPRNTGCGYVGIGEIASRIWPDVVRHPSARPMRDPLPGDCVDLVARLNAVIDVAEPFLDAVAPTCFLDDITTKNVLVDDGQLVGVVDFDVVCYGDPLFQVGLTAASVHSGFPEHCGFYVDELVRLIAPSELECRLLSLYEAVSLTQFVTAEGSDDGDPWRALTVTRAHAVLDGVESGLTREML